MKKIELTGIELNLIIDGLNFAAEQVIMTGGAIQPFYMGMSTSYATDQLAAAKQLMEITFKIKSIMKYTQAAIAYRV